MPPQSLAARQDLLVDSIKGVKHAKGVWNDKEEVHEMTIFLDYHDMTISLLLFSKDAPLRWDQDEEEPRSFDTYDNFISFDKRMSR